MARQWLKNIHTGGIWPRTDNLAKQSYMIPCESPEIEAEVPGEEHVMIVKEPVPSSKKDPVVPAIEEEIEEESTDLLDKDEAEALIKKWFGRTVDKVKVSDLYEYAKEQTGEDFPEKMTKLQIVTKLAAELAAREV